MQPVQFLFLEVGRGCLYKEVLQLSGREPALHAESPRFNSLCQGSPNPSLGDRCGPRRASIWPMASLLSPESPWPTLPNMTGTTPALCHPLCCCCCCHLQIKKQTVKFGCFSTLAAEAGWTRLSRLGPQRRVRVKLPSSTAVPFSGVAGVRVPPPGGCTPPPYCTKHWVLQTVAGMDPGLPAPGMQAQHPTPRSRSAIM